MAEQKVYRCFINWLKETWWGLPESNELMPLIMARYTPEVCAGLYEAVHGQPAGRIRLEEEKKNRINHRDRAVTFFYRLCEGTRFIDLGTLYAGQAQVSIPAPKANVLFFDKTRKLGQRGGREDSGGPIE